MERDQHLTVEQVEQLCPQCATKMRRRGLTHLSAHALLGRLQEQEINLPQATIDGLCAKWAEPGFFTSCMGWAADKGLGEGFCAALHKECVGKWPAEEGVTDRQEQLVEHFARGEILREARVDRASNTLQNVKLLGRESRNGRRYSDRALDDAARLYKGAPFYLDHPRESELRDRQGARSVLELAGRVLNPRRVGDAVRGDVELLDVEGSPVKSLVFAIAEQMPEQAGNSHRVAATLRPGAGGEPDLVESIEEVFGVELVTNPATAASLFESLADKETHMKDVTLEKLKAERPDLVQKILAEQAAGGETERLKAENAALKKKADEADAREALRTRQAAIAEKLEKVALPATFVTELFRKQLEEARDDAAVDALIAERRSLADAARSTGPVSVERDLDEARRRKGNALKPVDEAKIADYGRRLGVA